MSAWRCDFSWTNVQIFFRGCEEPSLRDPDFYHVSYNLVVLCVYILRPVGSTCCFYDGVATNIWGLILLLVAISFLTKPGMGNIFFQQ